MRDINTYLDAAKERTNSPSDRKLSLLIGLAPGALNHYRTGRAHPDDDTMTKLAALAGMDPQAALLDLNIWRSEGLAKSAYIELARRLGRTAAAFFCAGLLGATGVIGLAPHARASGGLDAANQLLAGIEQPCDVSNSIHYANYRTRK